MNLDTYQAAIVSDLALWGWSNDEAEAMAGDCDDLHGDGFTVDQAVRAIVSANLIPKAAA